MDGSRLPSRRATHSQRVDPKLQTCALQSMAVDAGESELRKNRDGIASGGRGVPATSWPEALRSWSRTNCRAMTVCRPIQGMAVAYCWQPPSRPRVGESRSNLPEDLNATLHPAADSVAASNTPRPSPGLAGKQSWPYNLFSTSSEAPLAKK